MSKRPRSEMAEPIEKHDSGFSGPMIMFPSFPHNDTFIETRGIKIPASPVDTTADVYTFLHHKQDYGIMRIEDATISATITLKTTATGAAPANDREIVLNPMPLRLGWKTREVYLNNEQINVSSSKENELSWVNHLMNEVPSGYNPSKLINLCIHNTVGENDGITALAGGGDTCVNLGARERYLACNQNTTFYCMDQLDLMGYNKRFVPTSFDSKVVLYRLEKTKMLFGNAAHCGAVSVHYTDLTLSIPIMKPKAQLSEAINELMIQKGEECKYYITRYCYFAHPLPSGSRRVLINNMFNGARPSRTLTTVKTQTLYNGAHTLDPNLLAFPNIDYFAIKVNEAIVPPIVHNSKEAYHNLRMILDRRYSEMPFSFKDYETAYGLIVTDLSPNGDSSDQILPNSTSGVISLDMNFKADTTAPQQLICIGEFRNQLSVGYHTQARMKYDF